MKYCIYLFVLSVMLNIGFGLDMLEEKYVNPFTDFGFKKLFGSEVNKELIIDFLNEIIQDQGRIVDLTFLKNEQTGRSESDRRAIFDIYCENEKGEKFIVEMQKSKQDYFRDRAVYYSTFPIINQAKKGVWNFELKAVFFIGIVDFVFSEDQKEKKSIYKHEVKLIQTETKEVFYDKLTFYFLEMPNFNKKENELETKLDKWLYLIKNLPDLDERPEKLNDKVFDQLFQAAELAKYSYKEMQDYEYSLKAYRDNHNTMEYAIKEASKKSHNEGFEEGHVKGLEEGHEQGDLSRLIQIIKKCLDKKWEINEIAEFCEISIEETERIIGENNLK